MYVNTYRNVVLCCASGIFGAKVCTAAWEEAHTEDRLIMEPIWSPLFSRKSVQLVRAKWKKRSLHNARVLRAHLKRRLKVFNTSIDTQARADNRIIDCDPLTCGIPRPLSSRKSTNTVSVRCSRLTAHTQHNKHKSPRQPHSDRKQLSRPVRDDGKLRPPRRQEDLSLRGACE